MGYEKLSKKKLPKRDHKWMAFGFFVSVALLFIVQSSTAYIWHFKSPYAAKENLASLPERLNVTLSLQTKLLGQKNRAAHDIGLFGNSRSVMLSSKNLGLQNDTTFFNFSVGGTSFLQSARNIEYLANQQRLPKHIIISIDNRHLQFDGFVYWPNPSTDIWKFMNDLRVCFSSPEASFKRCAKLANYYFYFASKHFAGLWAIENYQVFINYLMQNRTLPTSKQLRRLDGSIAQKVSFRDNVDHYNLPEKMSPIAIEYQSLAMESLVRIAKLENRKVYIFESPISPKYKKFLDDFQHSNGESLWRKISQQCDGIFIYCFASEMKTKHPWPDCCHAPAQPWADYIVNRLHGLGVFE